MNSRDWDFTLGDLGDPPADVKDWMIPPFPQCLIDAGVYNGRLKEEDECETN